MPRPPKNPQTRQRRNRDTTAAMLSADVRPLAHRVDEGLSCICGFGAASVQGLGFHISQAAPKLPEAAERVWHPMTKAWWRDIWRSPMAPEFVESDLHEFYILAALVDSFWIKPSTSLAAEIRLQGQRFGLTPLDRRRLQWEVGKVEAAEKRRRPAAPTPSGDPRRELHAV